MIRRFMLFFGPISSLFDFAVFAILLVGFDASHTLFRSGWFVESLATQSLAILAIRTADGGPDRLEPDRSSRRQSIEQARHFDRLEAFLERNRLATAAEEAFLG